MSLVYLDFYGNDVVADVGECVVSFSNVESGYYVSVLQQILRKSVSFCTKMLVVIVISKYCVLFIRKNETYVRNSQVKTNTNVPQLPFIWTSTATSLVKINL